jgi:hypothetical protein
MLGRSLKSLTKEITGQQISLQNFRHIMQGFIRYYMNMPIENPWGEPNRKPFLLFLPSPHP